MVCVSAHQIEIYTMILGLRLTLMNLISSHVRLVSWYPEIAALTPAGAFDGASEAVFAVFIGA